MKLLSICIPTYNRPDKLKGLYQTFLRLALNEYGDQIEVIVRDNSDDKNANINRSIFGADVRYYKNETNVGFCGNQIGLIRDAKGKFIWIISDDDLILWDGFKRLMSCLPHSDNDGIDCLMLPINYRNNIGELTENKNDVEMICDIDLKTYVTTLPVVPFGYFAVAIIRLNKKRLDWVEKEFHGNEIMNIPLFLTMLESWSKLRFLDSAVIEYKETYFVRGFDIHKYYYWHREVTSFLGKEFHADQAMLDDNSYKEFLLMVIAHQAGLRIYPNVKEVRRFLLAKLGQNLTPKCLILAVMIALPGSLMRPVYLSYLSLQHSCSKEKFSIGEVISRYKLLNNFIQSKQNERRSIK